MWKTLAGAYRIEYIMPTTINTSNICWRGAPCFLALKAEKPVISHHLLVANYTIVEFSSWSFCIALWRPPPSHQAAEQRGAISSINTCIWYGAKLDLTERSTNTAKYAGATRASQLRVYPSKITSGRYEQVQEQKHVSKSPWVDI